jgi:formate dehydrogenase major subunit
VPLRAGSDIAFLGGIIRYVLENDKWFRDYVLNYTNATTIIREDYQDTEDLGGVFAGLDEQSRSYESGAWQYEGVTVQAASGERDEQYQERLRAVSRSGHAESHGSGGAGMHGEPERDPTLAHPRCVLNLLRAHYARYTPEMAEDVCGVPEDLFNRVCEAITSRSGPDKTTSFAYAVGWTQHTVGAQFIPAASVLQLLLGNIGRPGAASWPCGAMRVSRARPTSPTLFNLLPGYLPMPHAHQNEDLDAYVSGEGTQKGYWADMKSYLVSLLKAWFGGAASADKDFLLLLPAPADRQPQHL